MGCGVLHLIPKMLGVEGILKSLSDTQEYSRFFFLINNMWLDKDIVRGSIWIQGRKLAASAQE